MRKERQRGAIVIEATISLSAFIFTIFTILMVVNIAFTQAKIGVALNSAAKEISQYSYLYYAFGADGLDAKLAEGTEDSKKLAEDTIDGVGSVMTAISGVEENLSSGDFDTMISQIEAGASNVDSLITQYADRLKDDPKGFIIGMGKMAANELKETGKRVLCQVLAKTFMQKNLMTKPGDDADNFLRRNRVVDGMDGLNFGYTTFLPNGNSNKIQLVVTYEIEVIKLLNIDFKFKIRQCSKTIAWGNGISVISPTEGTGTEVESGLWDMTDTGKRGSLIIESEKKNYTYTSTGNGFHAYNNAGGANEIVAITTLDPSLPAYKSTSQITARLESTLDKAQKGPKLFGSSLPLKQNGTDTTVESDPATRTYTVVLVIPDDTTDAQLENVAKAVKDFMANNPGVKVEVKDTYGGHTAAETTQPAKKAA